ncbi:MAG: peptidase S16, partial [Gammaproteobacteria bacterium]|nr:peptidase S16 [Gammaproteobacteria bacterium]
GTLVTITDWDKDPDGLLNIMTTGQQCFRVLSYAANADKLLIGDVELLPVEPPLKLDPEFAPLAEKLERLLEQLESYVKYPEKKLEDAVWVSNRLIELLPLQDRDKMILLQMQCANDRLRILQQITFE